MTVQDGSETASVAATIQSTTCTAFAAPAINGGSGTHAAIMAAAAGHQQPTLQ